MDPILPQVLGQTGKAKSYAERLFEFIRIGSLDENAAKDASYVSPRKRRMLSLKMALSRKFLSKRNTTRISCRRGESIVGISQRIQLSGWQMLKLLLSRLLLSLIVVSFGSVSIG